MVNRFLWSTWKLDLFFYFKCIQLLCWYKSPLRALYHVEDTFNQLEYIFLLPKCCLPVAAGGNAFGPAIKWSAVRHSSKLQLHLRRTTTTVVQDSNNSYPQFWPQLATHFKYYNNWPQLATRCKYYNKYYKYFQYTFLYVLLILYILLNTYLFYLAFLAFLLFLTFWFIYTYTGTWVLLSYHLRVIVNCYDSEVPWILESIVDTVDASLLDGENSSKLGNWGVSMRRYAGTPGKGSGLQWDVVSSPPPAPSSGL